MRKVLKWIKDWAIEIYGHFILFVFGHAKVQRCRECGCTDLNACVDILGTPCHWVEDDLCSSCAPFVRFYRFPWHENSFLADLNRLKELADEQESKPGRPCPPEEQRELEKLLNMSDEEREAVEYEQE